MSCTRWKRRKAQHVSFCVSVAHLSRSTVAAKTTTQGFLFEKLWSCTVYQVHSADYYSLKHTHRDVSSDPQTCRQTVEVNTTDNPENQSGVDRSYRGSTTLRRCSYLVICMACGYVLHRPPLRGNTVRIFSSAPFH